MCDLKSFTISRRLIKVDVSVSCILKANCLLQDANGKIGLTAAGKTEPKPVQVMSDHVIMKVASGGDHLVALTEQGDVYTVGCAEQGQLGRVAECFSHRGGRKGMRTYTKLLYANNLISAFVNDKLCRGCP